MEHRRGSPAINRGRADTYRKHEYLWAIVEVPGPDGKPRYMVTEAITSKKAGTVHQTDHPNVGRPYSNPDLAAIGHNHVDNTPLSGYQGNDLNTMAGRGDRRVASDYGVPILMTDPHGYHTAGDGNREINRYDLGPTDVPQGQDFLDLVKLLRGGQ